MIPTHTIKAYGDTYEVANLAFRDGFLEGDYRVRGSGEWEGLGTFPEDSIVTPMTPTHVFRVMYAFSQFPVIYEVIDPTISLHGFRAPSFRVRGRTSWFGPGVFPFHSTTVEDYS